MSARPDDVVEVHLDGEAPALGSGRRFVRVLRRGHKWVRVEDPHDEARHAVRLPRRVFDQSVIEPKERRTPCP